MLNFIWLGLVVLAVLLGGFTGQLVYEPASDRFYPEFLLKGYELKSTSPARIFSTKREEDPAVRILAPPL